MLFSLKLSTNFKGNSIISNKFFYKFLSLSSKVKSHKNTFPSQIFRPHSPLVVLSSGIYCSAVVLLLCLLLPQELSSGKPVVCVYPQSIATKSWFFMQSTLETGARSKLLDSNGQTWLDLPLRVLYFSSPQMPMCVYLLASRCSTPKTFLFLATAACTSCGSVLVATFTRCSLRSLYPTTPPQLPLSYTHYSILYLQTRLAIPQPNIL